MDEAERRIGNKILYTEDEYHALEDADCLLLVTEWKEFRMPDLDRVKQLLKKPVIFDGRNIYDVKEMKEAGFDYYCIGVRT